MSRTALRTGCVCHSSVASLQPAEPGSCIMRHVLNEDSGAGARVANVALNGGSTHD